MEFALVVPLLVMILFGIVEFGYAFYVQSSVASAARVGVRNYAINYAKPNATDTAISVAKLALQPLAPSNVVTATFTSPCATPGSQTTLVLTYRYHSLTGLLDGVLGSNINVIGKGSMACGG